MGTTYELHAFDRMRFRSGSVGSFPYAHLRHCLCLSCILFCSLDVQETSRDFSLGVFEAWIVGIAIARKHQFHRY